MSERGLRGPGIVPVYPASQPAAMFGGNRPPAAWTVELVVAPGVLAPPPSDG